MEQGRLILPQLLEVNKSQGWCNKSTRSELRSFRESSRSGKEVSAKQKNPSQCFTNPKTKRMYP